MNVETLLQQLIEAGTPAALVAKVAMELAKAELSQDKLERQRTYERDKKRNQRAAQNDCPDLSPIVPGTDGDNPLSPSPLLSPHTPQTTPHPHSPVDKPRARKADPFPMPEGVDPQHWSDFLTNRKRKRFPSTATAHKRLLEDIARWTNDEWPPGKLIEHAAARGWGSVNNPIEDNRHGTATGRNRQAAAKPVSSFTAVLREVSSGGFDPPDNGSGSGTVGRLGSISATF